MVLVELEIVTYEMPPFAKLPVLASSGATQEHSGLIVMHTPPGTLVPVQPVWKAIAVFDVVAVILKTAVKRRPVVGGPDVLPKWGL
jgi:hypothetical protein